VPANDKYDIRTRHYGQAEIHFQQFKQEYPDDHKNKPPQEMFNRMILTV